MRYKGVTQQCLIGKQMCGQKVLIIIRRRQKGDFKCNRDYWQGKYNRRVLFDLHF